MCVSKYVFVCVGLWVCVLYPCVLYVCVCVCVWERDPYTSCQKSAPRKHPCHMTDVTARLVLFLIFILACGIPRCMSVLPLSNLSLCLCSSFTSFLHIHHTVHSLPLSPSLPPSLPPSLSLSPLRGWRWDGELLTQSQTDGPHSRDSISLTIAWDPAQTHTRTHHTPHTRT